MKKIIAIALVVAMVLSMAGCGDKKPIETETPTVTPVVTPSVAPTATPTVEPTVAPTVAPTEEPKDEWITLAKPVGGSSNGGSGVIVLPSKDSLESLTEADNKDYTYKASAEDVETTTESGTGNETKTLKLESGTSGSVKVDLSDVSDDVNVVIDMPNAHIETKVVTTGTLTATTSDTTLVLGDGSSIGTIVISGGNVVVESGNEVEITTIGTIASGSNFVVKAGGILKDNETLDGTQTMDYIYKNSAWEIDSWENHTDETWYNDNDEEFEISTAKELAGLASLTNAGNDFGGKKITIIDDIDLTGKYWVAIGASTRSGDGLAAASKPFNGTFDGGNKTITGVTIVDTASAAHDGAVAFIGGTQCGVICNVNLDDVSIESSYSEGAGGLIGFTSYKTVEEDFGTKYYPATVENCTVSGSVSGKSAGGVVGRALSTSYISDCTNNANVYSNSDASGGIVGKAYYGKLSGMYVEIDNCVNNGTITAKTLDETFNVNCMAGGIVGFSVANIANCKNNGDINSYSVAGGITGEMQLGYIQDCSNVGDVVTVHKDLEAGCAGGVVGWLRYSSTNTSSSSANYKNVDISVVSNNANSGDIKGKGSAGGIIGLLYDAGYVYANANKDCDITADNFAGGIVGGLQNIGGSLYQDTYEVSVSFNESVGVTVAGNCKDDFAYNNTSIESGGLFFVGCNSKVAGVKEYTLSENMAISGALVVPAGYTLNVASGVTLTVDGTIINMGTLIVDGTVVNDGEFYNYDYIGEDCYSGELYVNGTFTNNGMFDCDQDYIEIGENGTFTNDGEFYFWYNEMVNNGTVTNSGKMVFYNNAFKNNGQFTNNENIEIDGCPENFSGNMITGDGYLTAGFVHYFFGSVYTLTLYTNNDYSSITDQSCVIDGNLQMMQQSFEIEPYQSLVVKSGYTVTFTNTVDINIKGELEVNGTIAGVKELIVEEGGSVTYGDNGEITAPSGSELIKSLSVKTADGLTAALENEDIDYVYVSEDIIIDGDLEIPTEKKVLVGTPIINYLSQPAILTVTGNLELNGEIVGSDFTSGRALKVDGTISGDAVENVFIYNNNDAPQDFVYYNASDNITGEFTWGSVPDIDINGSHWSHIVSYTD